MSAGQTLFERVATPFRLKRNEYWVGENHGQLAVPINYWINKLLDVVDLEDVEEILLFGRLLELRGEPTYRGANPQKIHLYIHTKSFGGGYEKAINELFFGEDRPNPCGLEFRITPFPSPIHQNDDLDWVNKTMQLYP